MASRNLPGGLALNGFWDLGEDGWNTGMDENLLKLSTLSHLSVISATTTLPGSPSEGDTYLVPSGDPEGDKVAVYDDAAWTYLDPFEGLQGYVQDDDQVLIYRDGAWGAQGFMRVFDEATASHTAVLAEANSYKRLSNASGVLLTIPANGDVAYPIGTNLAFEQQGAGAITFTAATGVTLRYPSNLTPVSNGQYSVVQMIKVAANEWTLFGNLVPVEE